MFSIIEVNKKKKFRITYITVIPAWRHCKTWLRNYLISFFFSLFISPSLESSSNLKYDWRTKSDTRIIIMNRYLGGNFNVFNELRVVLNICTDKSNFNAMNRYFSTRKPHCDHNIEHTSHATKWCDPIKLNAQHDVSINTFNNK